MTLYGSKNPFSPLEVPLPGASGSDTTGVAPTPTDSNASARILPPFPLDKLCLHEGAGLGASRMLGDGSSAAVHSETLLKICKRRLAMRDGAKKGAAGVMIDSGEGESLNMDGPLRNTYVAVRRSLRETTKQIGADQQLINNLQKKVGALSRDITLSDQQMTMLKVGYGRVS